MTPAIYVPQKSRACYLHSPWCLGHSEVFETLTQGIQTEVVPFCARGGTGTWYSDCILGLAVMPWYCLLCCVLLSTGRAVFSLGVWCILGTYLMLTEQ